MADLTIEELCMLDVVGADIERRMVTEIRRHRAASAANAARIRDVVLEATRKGFAGKHDDDTIVDVADRVVARLAAHAPPGVAADAEQIRPTISCAIVEAVEWIMGPVYIGENPSLHRKLMAIATRYAEQLTTERIAQLATPRPDPMPTRFDAADVRLIDRALGMLTIYYGDDAPLDRVDRIRKLLAAHGANPYWGRS